MLKRDCQQEASIQEAGTRSSKERCPPAIPAVDPHSARNCRQDLAQSRTLRRQFPLNGRALARAPGTNCLNSLYYFGTVYCSTALCPRDHDVAMRSGDILLCAVVRQDLMETASFLRNPIRLGDDEIHSSRKLSRRSDRLLQPQINELGNDYLPFVLQ